MALRYFDKDTVDETVLERNLITYINELVDSLNTLLFADKSARQIDTKEVLSSITEEGTYMGSNKSNAYTDLPNGVQDFTIRVFPTPTGTVQVLFSCKKDFKVYARTIINARTTEWKEL